MKFIRVTRIFLVVGSLAGGLLIGEGVSRLCYLIGNSSDHLQRSSDPRILVEPKPSVTYQSRFGQLVRVNRLGIKGGDVLPPHPDEYRILAVGDSTMAGEYLSEAERLPDLLAKRIRTETNQKVSVWNAAVGGYNAWQVLGTLETKAGQVQPNLVLIGVCANDYVPFRNKAYQIGDRVFIVGRDGSVAQHFNFLYQRSDLYKWFYDRIHRFRLSRQIATDGYEAYLKEYPCAIDASSLEKWEILLNQMAQKSFQMGAEPLFVFFPLHPQVYRGEEALHPDLVSWASKRGYRFIDLTQVFRKADPTGMSLYLKQDIVHPNAKAFEIASDSIYRTVPLPVSWLARKRGS